MSGLRNPLPKDRLGPNDRRRAGSPVSASATQLICRALVARALRHAGLQIMLKGGAGMAAVFIEDSRLADSVTRASCDLLRGSSRRRWTDWHVVDLVSRRSAKSSMANVDLLLEDGDDEVRIIFIIDDTTRLSAISWKLFDGRARLGVPDWARRAIRIPERHEACPCNTPAT